MKNKITALLLCVIMIAAMSSCFSDMESNSVITSEKDEINYEVQEYLYDRIDDNAANAYSNNFTNSCVTNTINTEEERNQVANDNKYLELQNSQKIEGKEAVYVKKTAKYGMEDLSYWGANNNITYPGAFLNISQNGESLQPIIGLKRKPMTISLGLEGATGVDYQRKTVNDVTQSSVGQAINSIFDGFVDEDAQLPFVVSMQLTEIRAKEEMSAALGISFNVGSWFNMDSEFDFTQKGEQTYAMLTLKQIYYTVNVDYDASLGAYCLLDDNVTLKDVERACPLGCSPVYVSSVSYGRIAAVTMKTSMSYQDLKASLNIGGGYGAFSGNADASFSNMSENGELQYNCFIYGGSIDGNQNVLECNNISDVIKNLNQPYDPKKLVGMPISYQLSNIADNSSAKIGFVCDYYYVEYIDAIRKGFGDVVYSNVIDESRKINQGDDTYYKFGAQDISAGTYIEMSLEKLDLQYIKAKKENVKIRIALDIKELNKGYQEIYIYNIGVKASDVQDEKAESLAGCEIEHGGTAFDANYKRYVFTAIIDPNLITSESLIIAFDAHGKDDHDDWEYTNLEYCIERTPSLTCSMYVKIVDLLENTTTSFDRSKYEVQGANFGIII